MKEKIVIGLAVSAFFFGYAIAYKRKKKSARKGWQLYKERKIIVN